MMDQDSRWVLHHGDCIEVLKTLPDNSVDSIVTDPPYGLSQISSEDVVEALRAWLDGKPYTPSGSGFMGKVWDAFVPGPEVWKECLRVLKPGGHLLAFAGTRTQDLMGMSIRLGGFELRDGISWNYGSGFPKSLDVSKALDKAAGAEREDKYEGAFDRRAGPTGNRKCEVCGKWLQSGSPCVCPRPQDAPATEAARQWSGWGTSLKPAHEPIVVARKPLVSTVAENILRYGVGGLNIDGCRVETTDKMSFSKAAPFHNAEGAQGRTWNPTSTPGIEREQNAQGRWPPNLVLTHSPECSPEGCASGCPVPVLDRQSGNLPAGNWVRTDGARPFNNDGRPTEATQWMDSPDEGGGASMYFPQFSYSEDDYVSFFYCPKAGRAERNEGLDPSVKKQVDDSREVDAPGANNPRNRGGRSDSNFHPTVKPIELMRWLVRLVTPVGGVTIDPFNGSGTTGCAALMEGMRYIGIERDPDYLEIGKGRLTHFALKSQGGVKNPWTAPAKAPHQEAKVEAVSMGDLFGFGDE